MRRSCWPPPAPMACRWREPGAEPDAEVTFVTRELAASCSVRAKIAATLSMTTSSHACVTPRTGRRRPAVPLSIAGVQRREHGHDVLRGRRRTDPYAGFEARIVPENITLLPKTATDDRRQHLERARRHRQKRRDHRHHPARDRRTAGRDQGDCCGARARGRDGGLKEGQRLRISFAPSTARAMQPVRVIVAGDSAIEAVVALSDTGQYVSVDVAQHRHRGHRRAATTRRTTATACGSTRASTRRRCATRFRGR